MELYNLGMVSWQQSQLLYHALAHLGREALCICSPATPYFSIGCHQNISEEINLDFCGRNNIPVFRREVGGGGVYLDSNQVFFQIILHRRSPHVSMCREAFYRKFLEPVVRACRSMGISARHGRMGDLAVEDRKIGGTGAGEIGDCVAFVGNIILDFHFDTMSRILKVPNEGFRARVRGAMEANMTTVRREIGDKAAAKWDQSKIAALVVSEFKRLFGPLVLRQVDGELNGKVEELADMMINDTWLHRNRNRVPGRMVTIRSGLQLCQESIETPVGVVSGNLRS